MKLNAQVRLWFGRAETPKVNPVTIESFEKACPERRQKTEAQSY